MLTSDVPRRVLVVGAFHRSIDIWGPALEAARAAGWRIDAALFPYRPDPSHPALERTPYDVLINAPIGEGYQLIDDDWTDLEFALLNAHAAQPFDAVIFTTCHLNSELEVARRLAEWPDRPALIGAQHGLFQDWKGYAKNFLFDRMLVFGPGFVPRLGPMAPYAAIAGLPKLDRITPLPPGKGDFVLFVGQHWPGADVVGADLASISQAAGLPIRIKPHPQYPELYASLPYEHLDAQTDARLLMPDAAFIAGAPSTAMIEAILTGRKAIVLPYGLAAEEFREGGIVSARGDGADVMALVNAWHEPNVAQRRQDYLGHVLANGGERQAEAALAAIEACIAGPRRDFSALALLSE